jgi:hypothetical protein
MIDFEFDPARGVLFDRWANGVSRSTIENDYNNYALIWVQLKHWDEDVDSRWIRIFYDILQMNVFNAVRQHSFY